MRVLVTVASKHGSTAEIGTAIAGILAEAGHKVLEQRPEDADDPSKFDAGVMGSGVYAGHWLLEAKAYALPCIRSTNDPIPEITANGRTFYVAPPRDPPTLAKRIY